MAKPKGRVEVVATGDGPGPPGPPRPAAQRPRDLEGWYRLGLEARGRFPAGAGHYDAGTIALVARELGVSRDLVWKAVDFTRMYRREELEELLRPPAGRPLTFSHVRRLLSIQDRTRRAELKRRASEEGWGHEELAAAIRQGQSPAAAGAGSRSVPSRRAGGCGRSGHGPRSG